MFDWVLVRASERAELEAGEAPPDFLSPGEVEALGKFKVFQRRRKWLLGRWAAKKLLVAALAEGRPGLRAEQITVGNEPSGLPFVTVDEGMRLPCSLSISHRADLAVAGLVTKQGVTLGIDLELVQPRDPVLVTDFFAPREVETIGRREGREQELAVAQGWSVKESVLKALGVGLRLDTRTVEVGVGPSVGGWPADWLSVPVSIQPWPAELTRRHVVACWRDEGSYVLSAAIARRIGETSGHFAAVR